MRPCAQTRMIEAGFMMAFQPQESSPREEDIVELHDRRPDQPRLPDPTETQDRIERYRNLRLQSLQWNSLLEKVESHRHSVRASVYDRVRKEYEEKKAALKQETDSLKLMLQREFRQFLDCRGRLLEEVDRGQENLEEMGFRIRVGEFGEEELQREIDTLGKLQDELLGNLKQVEEILRFFAESGLPEATDQPEGPGGNGGRDVEAMMPDDNPGVDPRGKTGAEGGEPQTQPHGYVTGYLVATSGEHRGERIPLISSNISLGSSPWMDIRLSDPEVNHLHARVLYKERKHYLENLDPMGRSLVNGIRTDLVELKDGDVVQLGKVTFQVGYDTLGSG